MTLLALAGVLGWGLLPTSHAPSRRPPPPGGGDAALHLSTIERIREGEDYYTAVGTELRSFQYQSMSVFNWRTPAHFELVAALSVPVARALLRGLTLGALSLLPLLLARESRCVRAVAFTALMGALATAVKPQAVVAAEVWAGVLVALSISAYYARAWKTGALFGVAALFMRELAAPYCAMSALLALKARRRSEAVLWLAAGVAYLAYFAVHANQVWAHQQPGDIAQNESWIRWNGLAFTAATVSVNGWLALAPHWATIIYVAVALAGALWSRMPRQPAASLLAYFLLFAIAGQPFNYYWGYVTAPIWAFSVAHGVPALRDLVRSSTGHRQDPGKLTAT